jgi:hypothetical protein
MFGVFPQRVMSTASPLLRGLGEAFPVPVSRHTEVRADDLPAGAELTVHAASEKAGLCLVEDHAHRAVYMFNHLEYDAETLRDEFLRDRRAGKPVDVPFGYFPDDDPGRVPANVWRPYGHLLFANWLGEIENMAPPYAADEAVVQWALSGPCASCAEGADHSDLLISAANDRDVLPSTLRALADADVALSTIRVHRHAESRQLIELRTERLEEMAIERLAHRLSLLSAVTRVAFRTGGVGGWLVGHRGATEPALGKARSLDRSVSIYPDAA